MPSFNSHRATADALARAPRAPQGTPYLLVDEEACDFNIKVAANYFAARSEVLRPHFKAHKCVELMRRQLAAGSCSGVTCATAWEARALSSAGFDDILVANEIVDPLELTALAEVAANARLSVAVDDIGHVRLLEELAAATGTTFGVLIDIDVGMRRGGMAVSEHELVAVAGAILGSRRLELRGLMGYEGHAALEPSLDTRQSLVDAAAECLHSACAVLLAHHIPCAAVSGGSTGTYDMAVESGAWTEIQAGSYVLMDATYNKLGLPFVQALYCVGTLISRHGDRGVINIGLKSLSAEYGMPEAVDASITVLGVSDEHSRVHFDAGNITDIGDAVLLVPSHVDPTVNLHDRLYVWRYGEPLQEWPVVAKSRVPSGVVA